MSNKYKDVLLDNYKEALKTNSSQVINELSIKQFCSDYGVNQPAWRIGPFTDMPQLTFRKTTQWKDPVGIGWQSDFIFNPSLLCHDGKLYMAYRSSPKKESACSRIGIAVYDEKDGWTDLADNPVIYPTEEDELLGCEDPKLYKLNGKFFLFYEAAWEADKVQLSKYNSETDSKFGKAFVATKLAVSDDMMTWKKVGKVVPLDISKGWSKGAVIPRNPEGEPVSIQGKYLMYLSEGCGGKLHVGYSTDLINWSFEPEDYLKLPDGAGKIAEVSCIAAGFEKTGKTMVMDFFFLSQNGKFSAGQALYNIERPFEQIDLALNGGTLSWGGFVQYKGKWLIAQGWDAREGSPEMYFYSADTNLK